MSGISGNAEPQLGIAVEKAKLGLGVPGSGTSGWHFRGYLPHYDSTNVHQAITFRLADSLPQKKLRQLEEELKTLPDNKRDSGRRRRIQDWLDAGMGCCALGHPAIAALVEETLRKFDGNRYGLVAWCIMPNHVHVLIRPMVSLAGILQSWKSFTGRQALARNAELGLGVPGKAFWMRDYWDRYIRGENHFYQTIKYIHDNPVKAGLCKTPRDWPWSSSRFPPGNAEPQLGSSNPVFESMNECFGDAAEANHP